MQKKKTEERLRELRALNIGKRKKRIKTILFLIMLAGLLYGIFHIKNIVIKFLWGLDGFTLKDVRIIPDNARTLVTQVIEIESGKNLLFLNIDELRDKILMIQEIDNCKVKKIYPDTLVIELEIRKPWMLVENRGNTFFIDKKGKVVYPIEENFVVFTKASSIDIETDGVTQQDLWKIEVLKDIEENYNRINLQKYIKPELIDLADSNNIAMYVEDGRKIILTKNNIGEKFEVLKIILEECLKNNQQWEYIDIRFQHPVVKHINSK